MADTNKNSQQRRGVAKRRNRRGGSARARLLQNDADNLLRTRKRRRMNTPLYSKRPVPASVPRADCICPVCAERISNLVEAMEYGEGEGPSHFGCVIRKLEKIHLPDKTQKRIVYRGQGSFMIVEQMGTRRGGAANRDKSSQPGLLIYLTIPYEIRERQAWRKELTNRLMERVLEV